MRSAVLAFICILTAHAQWLNHPTAGLPRLADGRPDLAGPAPKTSEGKPDLSGVWQAPGDPCDSDNSVTAGLQRPKYFVSVADARCVPAAVQNRANAGTYPFAVRAGHGVSTGVPRWPESPRRSSTIVA